MPHTTMKNKAQAYLQKLCVAIPNRRVGSEGNRAATDFFAETISAFGFDVTTPRFDCIDWREEGADLTVEGAPFALHDELRVSPYSLGGQAQAPLVVIASAAELEAADITGAIVLLRGGIAQEPLMPKHFPFYNPESHQHIVQLLESKQPQAIIAATTRSPELAGAVYPFPMIEDGDMDIPSVYTTEEVGTRLAEHAGDVVALEIRAERRPATGVNVIARQGADPHRRIVICAHIDAKDGTPGALDNASGITVLLLLADLLADYAGDLGIEIVALNGEDYYSAPGQLQYLSRNEGRFEEIALGVNLDGVGYHRGRTAYSLYGCPPALADPIHAAFDAYDTQIEGEPWYQGDHGIFLMHERPTLAMTSERLTEIMTEIVHTARDRPEIVAAEQLVDSACALRDLVRKLTQSFA